MVGRLTSGSYNELDRRLDDAIQWLETLGVRIKSTRIEAYRNSYNSLLEIYRSKDEEVARRKLPELVNMLLEIHDLIEIYKGLSDAKYTEYLHPRLQELSSGPFYYTDENVSSSNYPRNTAFELLLSSRLVAGGLPLGAHNSVDIATEVEGKTILFECKRPQVDQQISRNVKKAFKQLKPRYQDRLVRGIVAVDITKVANPDIEVFPYERVRQIDTWLSNAVNSFSRKHSALISESPPKTIAVIFRFSIVAVPKGSSESIVCCQQYEFNTSKYSKRNDKKIAMIVGRAIEKGVA